MPQRQSRAILFLPLVAGLWLAAGADAATWSADFSLSDERKTDVSSKKGEGDRTVIESPTIETVKQSYSISYEVEPDPALKFSLDLKLDTTDTIDEKPGGAPVADKYEIKPQLDFGVTAAWWDLAASWSDSIVSEQHKEKTEAVSSNVDLTVQPKSDALPEVKAKYKRDYDKEDYVLQKVDSSWEGSLDYKFWDLLDFSADVQRSYKEDLVQAQQDTEDRKIGFDASFSREIGESLKVEAKWTNERAQSRGFTDQGGADETKKKVWGVTKDDLKNTLEGKGTYSPMESLELSVDKKLDWASDLVDSAAEVKVTETLTSSAKYDQPLTETLDFSASYDDERKETRGDPKTDAYEMNKGYSTALDFSPLKNLTLSGSFDRTDDIKWLDHPGSGTEGKSHKIDDKWEFKADTSFWDENVKLSITRSLNATHENGDKKTDTNKWNIDFQFQLDSVPNLELSPKYTATQDNDLMADTIKEDRKIEVGIKYEVKLHDALTFSIDHTYGRTATYEGGKPTIIKRDDSTDLTLSWTDFFEGMKIETGFTRKANDQNEDDKKPIIDFTYKASFDWDIFKNYKFSFQYNFDKKQTSQDTQSFKTSLSADFLDGLLSLNLEHEFDEQMKDESGRETKDTHRSLIELQGKF